MATLNIDFNVKAVNNAERALGRVDKTLQSIQKYKININLGRSLTNLNKLNEALRETSRLYTQLNRKQTPNLTGLGGGGSSRLIVDQTDALRKAALETERYRTAEAKLKSELAAARLAKAQNTTQTQAASGSYREAQVRLTALGKAIREATNGFNLNNPAVQKQIAQYRALNAQLAAFDRQMGLNYRNVGNYQSMWGRLGQGLATAAAGYLSVFGAMQLIGGVVRTNAAISDSLADVQRTAELSKEEARGLFDELKQLETRTSLGELTNISVIGGQLGIAKDELVGFTEAVDILAVVLANEIPGGAEAVTEALGKINGVFRVAETEGLTAGDAMQKTGSAILALGQAGLATGRFLVDFTQRVGGAARTVGVALPTVLAYGAVLEEAGVSAEVAGTAVSKLIGQLAARRGEFFQIAKLADANLTLQQFTDLINTDADAALRKFFAGLAAGGKTTTQFYDILGRAKINTERYRNAVLLLSQDQEKLTELTALSTQEYEKGTKAAEQFELRNTTLGASIDKLTKAWQSLTTSGNVANFFQDIVDGASQALGAIDKLVNSDSWREFFVRLGGFGNAMGNLSSSLSVANIQADVLKGLKNAVSSPGGIDGVIESFAKSGQKEMDRLLKQQEQVVKMRSDTYQDSKSRKNLDELNYQAEILARMRYEYGIINKEVAGTSEGLEEQNELTKEQLRLQEQARKERERLENTLRKIQEENHLARLKGVERELQRIKNRYDEEIKAAKGANDIIIALQKERTKAIIQAIGESGALLRSLNDIRLTGTTFSGRREATAGQLNRGQGDVVPINIQRAFEAPKADFSDFTDGLKRATNRFVRDFTNGLDRIAQEADYKFGGIITSLTTNLINSFQSVFQNFFANKLEGLLGSAFDKIGKRFGDDMGKRIQGIVAGVAVVGGAISQLSKPTSVGGQAIGGALSGAAAGFTVGGPIGAVVGGLLGGITSAIGANRRRKIEEEQLAEQRKQTALMERQQRLLFTSSIIGQQTNQGIINSVERNALGDIVFRVQGRALVATLENEQRAKARGF